MLPIPDHKAFPIRRLLLLLLLSHPVAQVSAAPIPDAGSILRDQKQSLPQPKTLTLPEEKKTETAKDDVAITVAVKGFSFGGYEGVATEAELQAIVAVSTGKNLSFAELNALVDKITESFRKKGVYQARAYLPAQDITSGNIHITVIQVKSDGTLSLRRDRSVRIRDRVLRGFFKSIVRNDQPVNEHDLERSLLLINDIPGVSSKASLLPGTETGKSGLEVTVTEGPLFSGSLWGDNQGNRYSGELRGNAMLSCNDPFHYGDQISMFLTDASGLTQGRVGYTFPLPVQGIRGNLSWSGMHYQLGSELASLKYAGRSNSIDAGLSYPLLRTRRANLTASLTYGFRSLIDTQSDTDIRNKQINTVSFQAAGDRYDQFLGGGYTSYSVGVTTGKLHESIADISLTGAEGGYTHFNGSLGRMQRLSDRFTFNISGSGQMALGNLDSSEKFSLGGPNGVRAYPGGEASGDEGQLINAECRYTLPVAQKWGSFQLSGFYDTGHITLTRNRFTGDVSNVTGLNDYWLQGAGIGLNYTYSRYSLRALWARVIGDNPGRSSAGNNSDGQSTTDRFWLQGTFSF